MDQWRVYYFLSPRGENVIKEWLRAKKIAKSQIAVLQDKIDTLEQSGPEMVSGFISDGPVGKHLYKMKVRGHKGHVQLRPLCCKGPFADREFTILFGAIERGSQYEPKDAIERAQDNRTTLLSDPARRRRDRLAD